MGYAELWEEHREYQSEYCGNDPVLYRASAIYTGEDEEKLRRSQREWEERQHRKRYKEAVVRAKEERREREERELQEKQKRAEEARKLYQRYEEAYQIAEIQLDFLDDIKFDLQVCRAMITNTVIDSIWGQLQETKEFAERKIEVIQDDFGCLDVETALPEKQSLYQEVVDSAMSRILYACTVNSYEQWEFQCIVSDSAEIIRHLGGRFDHGSSKNVFQNYIAQRFGNEHPKYRQSKFHVCPNCGQPVITGFPYCLNCYRRNEVQWK